MLTSCLRSALLLGTLALVATACGSSSPSPADKMETPEGPTGSGGTPRRDSGVEAAGGAGGGTMPTTTRDGGAPPTDGAAGSIGADAAGTPMIPAVPTRRTRRSLNDAKWKFRKADVPDAIKTDFVDGTGWQDVTIPHDFNGGSDGMNNDVFNGACENYRGVGYYRARFQVESALQGSQLFVEFEAVSLVADVWLNGQHLGQHKGGYTAFSFDVTPHVKFGAENLLVVKANSANDPTVAPWMDKPFSSFPMAPDYAVYGGIYRDVWLTVTDKIRIDNVLVDTPQISAASSLVRARTEVVNHHAMAKEVVVETEVLDPEGKAVVKTMTAAQSLPPGQRHTFTQTSAAVTSPRLWSPDKPTLYQLRTTVKVDGQAADSVVERFGFRWFSFPKTGPITFNGQPFFLRGVARHQDKKGRGAALTNEEHLKDVRLIKDVGFNFLRHGHYPADPAVMAAADELGLLVWLEIPMTVTMSTHPEFLENAKQQISEMVKQNYNHPSVLLWGVGNESDQALNPAFKSKGPNAALTSAHTVKVVKELNDLVKQLDPTRPTTGCNWYQAALQNIVDTYSPQIWIGWYNSASYIGMINPTQLVGEFGADSDIAVNREPSAAKMWDVSQTYAAKLIEYYVAAFEARKHLFPGYASFVMFDFASTRSDRCGPDGPRQNTIKGINQKGLVNSDHQTAKDVLYFFRSFLKDGKTDPMVYIVSHHWLDRWTAPAAKDVWVYSNAEEVRLYNAEGGREPLGARKRDAGEHPTIKTRFQWNQAMVRYNVLYAEALVGGKVVATDKIVLKNLPPPP